MRVPAVLSSGVRGIWFLKVPYLLKVVDVKRMKMSNRYLGENKTSRLLSGGLSSQV